MDVSTKGPWKPTAFCLLLQRQLQAGFLAAVGALEVGRTIGRGGFLDKGGAACRQNCVIIAQPICTALRNRKWAGCWVRRMSALARG